MSDKKAPRKWEYVWAEAREGYGAYVGVYLGQTQGGKPLVSVLQVARYPLQQGILQRTEPYPRSPYSYGEERVMETVAGLPEGATPKDTSQRQYLLSAEEAADAAIGEARAQGVEWVIPYIRRQLETLRKALRKEHGRREGRQ